MTGSIVLWLVVGLAGPSWAQLSMGCFKNSAPEPILPVLVAKKIVSPAECIQECRARYYMFSGLINGVQCSCGSHYGKTEPSNDCKDVCLGDTNQFCGSDEAINIYSTGQKGPSPPRSVAVTNFGQDTLEVNWLSPDIPNGKIVSYTVKAEAIETFSSVPLQAVQNEVQGEFSNVTTLYGLHPGTKYNITIFATNTQGSSDVSYTIDWTRLGPPSKPSMPKIVSMSEKTITIEVPEGHSENGPLSFYHVVVVQAGTIPPMGHDVMYENYIKSSREGYGYYITGRFDDSDFGLYKNFVVGDERIIGGYYNAPLNNKNGLPGIGIAVESRDRGEVQYSYSDLTMGWRKIEFLANESPGPSTIRIILWVLIVILSILLVASVLFFLMLRQRFQQVRMQRLPESQELTLQGPLYEVDNMAYIPEDVPERTNHYQELKTKVWSIPRNNLNFDPNPMKRGLFGTIHLGTVQRDASMVPVSVHKISDTALRNSEKRKMLRELDICIKAGSSKYLASLVGNCETQDVVFVVIEMPPQNLKARLLAARSGDHFPHEQILRIGACIANALRHLDSLKIIHTRVCARSVGLNADWSPKLMGHGISKYALEDVKFARWTALECFSNQVKHQPGVVWAYGVLLWEMFSMGGTPYSNLEMDSDVENAVNDGLRLQQLMDMPDPIYEVMSSCWLTDPEERPTFDELVRLNTLSICPITSITEAYRPELELNMN
ncbi:putative tyrosine-protein kinase Wsck [Copidosoma floridanum]|uniref:putative tyrosine-protein kinase Wsck n=1 Tax=Copidosoma floridanum TaxID=29053 RepID=UPI0006C98D08|nr:putative tyrosine-protein kinase Wsck [Copidosoma floridanum]